MANTLTSILPKVLARALPVLRRNAVMPQLVTTGYSLTASQKGKTVDIEVPKALTAAAITNSNTPPSNTDVSTSTVQITMDQWQGTDFHLSDQELTQIDIDSQFVPAQLGEAIKAVANAVDLSLLNLYKDIYNASGTAGTTPFASNANVWTTGARKFLNQNSAPMSDRYVVLDSDAEANAVALSEFQNLYATGQDDTILNGEIGQKLGARWFLNQGVPSFTRGTLTGSPLVNDASYTVGETTVDIDAGSLTGTVVIGDIFTVAGDTQQYTVTANATASSNAITGMAFTPASAVAWADNAAVTFVASHAPNLAFHRGAFALATAPFAPIDPSLGMATSIQDPVTGLILRLEVRRDYKQTTWEVDALWGVKTVRPELAARIMG